MARKLVGEFCHDDSMFCLERALAETVLFGVMVLAKTECKKIVWTLPDASTASNPDVRDLDGAAATVRHTALVRTHEVTMRL